MSRLSDMELASKGTLILLLGILFGIHTALAQQSFCEHPQVKEMFLTEYVCKGLVDCAFYGDSQYSDWLARSEEDIRARQAATPYTPAQDFIAKRNEAGLKYIKIGDEIAANAAIASRKVVQNVKIVPSFANQNRFQCAVFLDIDATALARTEFPTALTMEMNQNNGFVYKLVMQGLEANDIRPFETALKEAQAFAQIAVRSVKRNTDFTLVLNGTELSFQAGGNITEPISMIFEWEWYSHFYKGWDRYR